MNHKVPIDDLAYELRMLFGAAKLCQLLDKQDVGNPVNFMKDSVYLHTRNLYNFFAANTGNDAKVTQFTTHTFNLSFYNTWIDALHDHALHIKTSRHTPTNVVGADRLNEQIQNFATDIEGLWNDWIAHTTPGSSLETKLKDALAKAHKEAQDDYDSLEKRLAPISQA